MSNVTSSNEIDELTTEEQTKKLLVEKELRMSTRPKKLPFWLGDFVDSWAAICYLVIIYYLVFNSFSTSFCLIRIMRVYIW